MAFWNRKKRNNPPSDKELGIRLDGWVSALTGIGAIGQDKRLSASHEVEYLTMAQAEELWRSNDIGANIVEKLPKEALRPGYEIVMDSDAQLLMQKRVKELRITKHLLSALSAERALGGAAIFPVMIDDRSDLREPLNKDRIARLSHFMVLDPRELRPARWNADIMSPKYGQPETYYFYPKINGGVSNQIGAEIHESRLIIFPGLAVTRHQVSYTDNWGDSVLQRPHEVLRDFGVAWSAVGIMLTDFVQTVISIKGLAEMLANDQDDAFRNRIKAVDMARSVARAVIIDADGEEFKRYQTPVSGLADLLDRFESRLAAAANLPITILFGRSPAGMNATGESDIRIFYDNVDVYRELRVRDPLEAMIDLILRDGTGPFAGRPIPEWTLTFKSLWQPTQSEIADARLKVAQTDNLYVMMGVVDPDEVAYSRWGGGNYSPEMTIDFEERERLAAQEPLGTENGEPENDEPGRPENGEPENGEPENGEPENGEPENETTDEDVEEVLSEIDEVVEEEDPNFVRIKVREHTRRIPVRKREDAVESTTTLWAEIPAEIVASINKALPTGLTVQGVPHLTLAHSKNIGDFGPFARNLESAIRDAPPITANVTGIAQFWSDNPDRMPLVALVNLVQGTLLHAKAIDAFSIASSLPMSSFLGFLPHITIDYRPPMSVDMIPMYSEPWVIRELELVRSRKTDSDEYENEMVTTIRLTGPRA